MVFRVEKNVNYTVMSNYHLREKEMSLKAKGLLSWMLSNDDSWDYSIKGIVANCKESEQAVKTTLKELQRFGYLQINKLSPDSNNPKIHYEYVIYENPQGGGFQPLDDQPLDDQGVENPPQRNTIIRNTKKEEKIKKNKDVPVLTGGIKKSTLTNKGKTTFKDCFNQINEYTDDKELRKCLTDYLTLRIQMLQEKPMKATQWKYMMEKLDELQRKSLPGTTKADIVKHSIERQYPNFYSIDGKYFNVRHATDASSVPMWEKEGIRHGRYDNENHSRRKEAF